MVCLQELAPYLAGMACRAGHPQKPFDSQPRIFAPRVYAVLALQAREVAVRDLRALLFRTGKNIVIDDARRRQVDAQLLQTLALVAADDAPSTERVIASRQQLELLVRRLTAMPRKRREVFVLVRIYGFSHAEAAAHMDISIASVEKHVVRAVCGCMGLDT